MQKLLSLHELRDAALREDWDAVDASLSGRNEDYEIWALDGGMEDVDPNLRDLAVSILERSPRSLDARTVEKLTQLMSSDQNPYVRFRSAFVLCGHDVRNPEILSMLKNALADKDVSEIAAAYIAEW